MGVQPNTAHGGMACFHYVLVYVCVCVQPAQDANCIAPKLSLNQEALMKAVGSSRGQGHLEMEEQGQASADAFLTFLHDTYVGLCVSWTHVAVYIWLYCFSLPPAGAQPSVRLLSPNSHALWCSPCTPPPCLQEESLCRRHVVHRHFRWALRPVPVFTALCVYVCVCVCVCVCFAGADSDV